MDSNLNTLWVKVKQGDPHAWRQIVRLYSGLVHTVAHNAGLSRSDAEDCAQYTWLQLFKKRKSIRQPSALPAWLIRTTHRQAICMVARLKPNLDIETAADTPDSGDLPDDTITRLEAQAMFEYALKQLDPRCRQLLESLFYSPDKPSYQAIAKSLNILPNSIGSMRTRCLNKMKKILEKIGYRED
ncbi:MAG: RNA polymerase sigma factor [Candidatus Zixiibacteriota bacterium]